MDVQIRDLSKKEANLSIMNGVLYLIQHELLKTPNTEFAGVITRHPLTNELWMRVISTNPIKDIVKAIDTAISTTVSLKKLITSKIKSK
jgi:DNA-directed RNA polymerase subunit L